MITKSDNPKQLKYMYIFLVMKEVYGGKDRIQMPLFS